MLLYGLELFCSVLLAVCNVIYIKRQLFPSGAHIRDSNYIHAYHLKGLMYHAEGKFEEALNDFLNGLIYDPKHVECRVMAGLVLHGMGNLTEAIKHYTLLVMQR